MRYLVEMHARRLRRACDCIGLSRSVWYAPPLDWTVRDAEIIAALSRLVEAKPSRGIGKCCRLLKRSHPHWNRGDLAVPDRLQRAPPPQRPRRHDASRVSQHQNLYFRSVCLTGELTVVSG